MPVESQHRAVTCDIAGLSGLVAALKAEGLTTIGPRLRQGAIVCDEIDSADDLPAGWGVETGPGVYRLVRRDDGALFANTVALNAWKSFLHPPRQTLVRLAKSAQGFEVQPPAEAPAYAFIGVRPCDLRAIAVQDGVFLHSTFQDRSYGARRKPLFIVAVNCTVTAASCFCVSTHSGPRAGTGFDLALTEVIEPGEHLFVVEVGSARGAQALQRIAHREATDAHRRAAAQRIDRAAGEMGRGLPTDGLKELLYASQEDPHWRDVAERCLACANCTMVCPTCFCSTVHEVSDLDGQGAQRVRVWDSCFTGELSYLHGGPVRYSGQARYRQWLTHKLASWHEQFGGSGCVGCGRCIAWCPAGIDITREVAAIGAGGR